MNTEYEQTHNLSKTQNRFKSNRILKRNLKSKTGNTETLAPKPRMCYDSVQVADNDTD